MRKSAVLFMVLLYAIATVNAQNYKFGKVSIEELEEKASVVDSTADAEVLYYKERIEYPYTGYGRFYRLKKVHIRIKIYSKKGYGWANHSMYLWGKYSKDGISDIKGITYNLKDGQIIKSKLKKDNIFKEEVNKNLQKTTLTMPDVKEYCVLEFKYNMSVGASGLNDILLQNLIPIRKVDYEAKVPDYLELKAYPNYHSLLKPKLIKRVVSREEENGRYRFFENIFVVKEENIPALKEEVHVSNLNKYMSKISFELSSVNSKNLIDNWDNVVKYVYESSSFGKQLEFNKYFKEDLDKLSFPSGKINDKIEIVFNYLKSKVKWNNVQGYYTYNGVKEAYETGEGNVADINLMLVAMLRYIGINANPILVSTKSNGIPLFPTREGFNYVVCGVENKEVIILDATQQYTSINNLPEDALNWQGRIIRKHGSSTWVNLYPKNNSIETNILSVEVNNDLEFVGGFNSQKTDYLAYNYRRKYAGISEEILLKIVTENTGLDITNLNVINLENVYKPIREQYNFKTDEGIEEIGSDLYLNPLVFLTVKENVFNKEHRDYPIDFEYPVTYKTIVNLKIPEKYKIKSFPTSEKVMMIENLGEYSFIVRVNKSSIQISQILKINTPTIPANYYGGLRDMYKKMLEKNAEKIVLEKI